MEMILFRGINLAITIWKISSPLFFKSVNDPLWYNKSPIQLVVMNQEKHILSKSLTKHVDETWKLQRGNICLLYVLCLKAFGSLSHWMLQTTERNSLTSPLGNYRVLVEDGCLK